MNSKEFSKDRFCGVISSRCAASFDLRPLNLCISIKQYPKNLDIHTQCTPKGT